MDSSRDQVGVRRTVSQIGAAVLAVALVIALLRALETAEAGHGMRAAGISACALGVAASAVAWWNRRGKRGARVLAALVGVGGLGVWGFADTMMGVPMFAVAICVLVVEFAMWVGAALGAVMVAGVLALYMSSGEVPFGGVAMNIAMIVAVVVAGLGSAHLVARLDRAIELDAESARLRREEALAEMDRVLVDERMAYARMLHDELGQRLTVVGMGLDLAMRMRDGRGESHGDAAWAEVERTREHAAEALDELRTLVRSMSPLGTAEIRRLDVDSALEAIARSFNGTGLNVSVQQTGGDDGGELDQLAYRIIQEGLTNAARHSDAHNVTVLVHSGAECSIRISDDGGAAPAKADEGFGLLHLRERVELAGGTLLAEPGDGGFVLEATYPLHTAAA